MSAEFKDVLVGNRNMNYLRRVHVSLVCCVYMYMQSNMAFDFLHLGSSIYHLRRICMHMMCVHVCMQLHVYKQFIHVNDSLCITYGHGVSTIRFSATCVESYECCLNFKFAPEGTLL